ncbi:MAG: DUF6541 family protein [Chloroflexota bacterium]
MLGVLFALIALVAGWAVCRVLGIRLTLAPAAGLALVAVAASWAMAFGLPLSAAVAAVVGIAAVIALRRPGPPPPSRAEPLTLGLLAIAPAVPAALLGFAFAGLDVPVSNHDGVFHVETVDALRRGVGFETWYPRGYHASVAAVLGFTPWVDSARGTAEASEGITILAPLAVFGLGRSLGARPRLAAVAAIFQALTFIYPYDFHIWGGWPLGMGVVLLLGVWTAVLAWLERPSAGLAAVVGLLGGAIVLAHGTEIYSMSLGLVVITVARVRHIKWRQLGIQLPLAVGLGAALASPYLQVLVGWARGGGASEVGSSQLLNAVADPELQGGGLLVQLALGAVGATSFVDLPVRAVLIAIGMRLAWAGLARWLWLVVVGVLLTFAFVSNPLLERVFVVTYPWLADQRLLQVACVFASLLAAGGLLTTFDGLANLRKRMALSHRRSARWVSIAAGLLALFLAEGSGVSIYKRLALASDSTFTHDDRSVMEWLHQHARPGEILANDSAVDAGIWAPYKAGVPLVLPRSASGEDADRRQSVLNQIADLESAPEAEAEACHLGVRYVYYGAHLYGYEEHHFPPPAVLARSPGLQEAFHSGNAVVFQTRLACD